MRIFKRVVGIVSASLLCMTLIGCGNKNSTSATHHEETSKIYSVKIESITTNSDGNFIIKGSTSAPKGTKVFAQCKNQDGDINYIENSDADWVKVGKNGKVSGQIDGDDVIYGKEENDWKPQLNEKGQAKIFAATNAPRKTDSTDIPRNVRRALKDADIKNTVFTADQKIVDYYKDKDSSSSSSNSSQSSKSSSDNNIDTSEDYQPISYDDLARHPKENLNKPIVISGTVLQVHKVDGEMLVLMYMDGNPDETLMVVIDNSDKPKGEILEKDQITIKGNAGGKQSYETVLGNDREIPYVDCNETVIDNGRDASQF